MRRESFTCGRRRGVIPLQCRVVNARTLIHRRTAERARRFPDLDPHPLACDELPSRDAALARAIDHFVARRWLTLAAVVDSRLTEQRWHGLQPTVKAALLVGAAQLLLMERIPDHAAIDQAVRWIKTTRRARASGLVNAVLRKIADLRGEITCRGKEPHLTADLPRDAIILDDGRWLTLAEPVFEEATVARLAQQASCNEELVSHWMKAFGSDGTIKLALHGLVHAPIIVGGIGDQVPSAAQLQHHQHAGFAVFTGERDELDQLLTEHPQLRIQDPTTARSVNLARHVDPVPSLVIDYCAGKGTKTRQLAQMFPNARIIATDKDSDRFATLAKSMTDAPNVETVPFQRIREFLGMADLLVLDVPCSNTGVLARRVEAKYRFTRETLGSLVNIQRQILANSIPLMKEDAWMLYITCSVEPSENRQQVEWMAETLPLSLIDQHFTLPNGLPGEPATAYHDGGYAAVMRWSMPRTS